MTKRLRLGFIPFVDAAALIVAADKGFCAAEGLDVELVREVSWSNVRDKLNIGLFDAAHLLAPVAIASSLGLGHVKVPIIAPFDLGLNGNAITVSPTLFAALAEAAGGDLADPMRSARALAKVVAARKAEGAEPLTFGMTFPYSTHNYQLRFWMAAAGVDPDEDVRLVVLPPPYMVDSLKNGHVDAFCVGAPWNSVAVDLGIGHILHFVSEILARAAEKVLALRQSFADDHPDIVAALVRAHGRAADFIEAPENHAEVAAILAAPERIGVAAEVIQRTLDGRLKVAPDGTVRAHDRYLLVGGTGSRSTPRSGSRRHGCTRRWCAGDRRRYRPICSPPRKPVRPDHLRRRARPAMPLPAASPRMGSAPSQGPAFAAADIAGHLAAWPMRRP